MTPQERQLVEDLFKRLASLENAPRDRQAEQVIEDGFEDAPNAAYALVQTVLVQDEALRQANARIQELEGTQPSQQQDQPGGFLDSMRDTIFGKREQPRPGSVPPVGTPTGPGAPMGVPPGYRRDDMDARPGYRGPMNEPPMPQQQAPGSPMGTFLGTAAAAAAGVIGGSLLLDGIRSMMNRQSPTGLGPFGPAQAAPSPWSSNPPGDLANQAGIDDIGRQPFAQQRQTDDDNPDRRQSLLTNDQTDNAERDNDQFEDTDFDDDTGTDTENA
jgi:hypothetical protein